MRTQETWTDSIVDDVRRIRDGIVQEAGGDLESLGRWLMTSQERNARKLVTLMPQGLKDEV